MIECPSLLNDVNALKAFHPDAVTRAKAMVAGVGASTGAYTNSKGFEFVRHNVARFIAERDGFPSNADHIFLADGASPAVKAVLTMLIRDSNDGILCPIPQYPLYSASITLFGGTLLPYYLDESKGWSMSIDELNRALRSARANKINPRALVVINPGNPTGQVSFCLSFNCVLLLLSLFFYEKGFGREIDL